MYAAAKDGNLTEVRNLLKECNNVNEELADTKETPIFSAVTNNHAEIVLLLLKNGANPNIQAHMKYDKAAPLHIAAKNGFYYIASLLIKYGANVDIEDGYKNTPLHIAAACGHYQIVDLLIANNAKVLKFNVFHQTPVHKASQAETGNANGLLMILEKGIDVNIPCKHEKNTALLYSTYKGFVNIARILLEHGADKTMKNSAGKTALDIATEMNNKELVLLLE